MVADRRHISENNKSISLMSNQLQIITVNEYIYIDIWILGEIGKFTKIICKIHDSRKKKRGQSRITEKIKECNSQFTKKIKLNSRFTEKIRARKYLFTTLYTCVQQPASKLVPSAYYPLLSTTATHHCCP